MIKPTCTLVKEAIQIHPVDMRRHSIWTVIVLAVFGAGYAIMSWSERHELRALRETTAIWAATPPVIDGRLDESIWDSSQATSEFVYSDARARAPLACQARVVWTDHAVYFAFDVADRDLDAPHTTRDAPLYTRDVVEVFIDPDGDMKEYFEFEVSPRGTVFDARFPSYRENLERSKQFSAASFEVAVRVNGTLDSAEEDRGYIVEMKVDYSDLGLATAPKAGERWRINMFRIDYHGPNDADYTAWTAPLVGDFHALDRFGQLHFVR